MRARLRSVSQSPFWAYLVCFVVGGATIGLATFAYLNGAPFRLTSARADELARDRLRQPVAVATAREALKSSARGAASPSLSTGLSAENQENVVQPSVLIARVTSNDSAALEAPTAGGEPTPQTDADADEGLSSQVWAPVRTDTYRTVCVRLCDGSFTPVSFATTRDKFKADAVKCAAGCSSPTRLFYAKAGASELVEMIDVHGASYVDLPNAFRFQTTYEAGCTCRGQPWEAASVMRHHQFAAAALGGQAAQSRVSGQTRQTLAQDTTTKETVAASGDRPVLTPGNIASQPEKPSSHGARAAVPEAKPIRWNRLNLAAASNEHGAVKAADPADVKFEPGGVRIPQSALNFADTPATSTERSALKVHLASPSKAVSKAHPAALAAKRSAEPRSGKSVADWQPDATARSAARDTLVNVRGNSRAQREFRTHDYWRLSFWEPR